jgi:hypothetical protein
MNAIYLLFLTAANYVIADSSVSAILQVPQMEGAPVPTATDASSISPLGKAIVPTVSGQIGINPVSVPNIPEV